jgi:hypothetical protein
MAIFHRSSEPSASTAGLTWSSSPTETPPLVRIRSLPAAASRSAARVASSVSGTMPRSAHLAAQAFEQGAQGVAVGVVDAAGLQRLARHGQFVAGGKQRHAQAAEDRQPRRTHRGGDADMPAASAACRRPAPRRRRDVLAGAAYPLAGMRHVVDRDPALGAHSSCITTASAPAGTGAPVKMRAAVPGASGRRRCRPGCAAPRQAVRRPARRRSARHSHPSRCCRAAARRWPKQTLGEHAPGGRMGRHGLRVRDRHRSRQQARQCGVVGKHFAHWNPWWLRMKSAIASRSLSSSTGSASAPATCRIGRHGNDGLDPGAGDQRLAVRGPMHFQLGDRESP